MSLKKYDSNIKNLLQLSGLKESFKTYVADNNEHKEQFQEFQTKSIQESSWIQLLLTLKFWLDDVSPKFEKQISILKSQ
jgi:hypothetical protein